MRQTRSGGAGARVDLPFCEHPPVYVFFTFPGDRSIGVHMLTPLSWNTGLNLRTRLEDQTWGPDLGLEDFG